MLHIESVQANPNPKVASFKINTDILKSGDAAFSKLIIPKTSELIQYVPLAQALFHRTGDTNRIDIVNEGPNETLISVSRSLINFEEDKKQFLLNRLNTLLNHTPDFIPLDLTGITNNIKIEKPLNLESKHQIAGVIFKAFYYAVTPLLQRDGGAMELTKIDYNPATGEIDTTVALVGSCNSCTSAKEHTLGMAFNQVSAVLKDLQEKHQNDNELQRMKLKPIQQTNIDGMALSRVA